jgi:uncharacterized protein
MEFEWDPEKAKKNKIKHKVTFGEAASIFGDALAITYMDPDHSSYEKRYITFGLSWYRRLLVVSYTEREERIRIISARLMKRKERKIYEQG